jgi:hypothetical protein
LLYVDQGFSVESCSRVDCDERDMSEIRLPDGPFI